MGPPPVPAPSGRTSPQNPLVFGSEAALDDLCAAEADVDDPEMDCG